MAELTGQMVREILDTIGDSDPATLSLTTAERYADGEMRAPFAPELASGEHQALQTKALWPACKKVVQSVLQDCSVNGYVNAGSTAAQARGSALWDQLYAPGVKVLMRHALTGGTAYSIPVYTPQRGWIVVFRRAADTHARWHERASDVGPYLVATRYRGAIHGWNEGTSFVIDEVTKEVTYGATSAQLLGDLNPVATLSSGDYVMTSNGPWPEGIVAPLIPAQDKLNQNNFDLLLVASYGAVTIRAISGIDLPDDELDAREHKLAMAADRFITAASPESRFTSLIGTPLPPYIQLLAASLGDLAIQAGIPPNRLMVSAENIGADTVANLREGYVTMINDLRAEWEAQLEEQLRALAVLRGGLGADLGPDGHLGWRNVELVGLGLVFDAAVKADSMGMNAETVVRRGLSWRPEEKDSLVDGYQEARRSAALSPAAAGIIDATRRAVAPSPAPGRPQPGTSTGDGGTTA